MTYRYSNSENSWVQGPGGLNFPASTSNRHYRKIVASGVQIEAYVPPATTPEDVQEERRRRLALGFDYDFGDARGVHRIGTTEADLKGWDEVTSLANALMNTNNPNTQINVVTDTGPCVVTASEWQLVMLAAAQVRQVIWAKSFLLQATLPSDYKDDSHWVEG